MERNQVFVSYSKKDQKWLDDFKKQIAPLVRNRTLELWDETRITPGQNWREQIEAALSRARVAVLLVTPDFLASDFIDKHVLPPLRDAAKREGLTILWILVRPCSYEKTALASYQPAHDIARPLNDLAGADRDRAWVKICQEVDAAFAGEAAAATHSSLQPERMPRSPVVVPAGSSPWPSPAPRQSVSTNREPGATPGQLKVYISSASDDLDEYRRVAREVVLDMKWQPVMIDRSDAPNAAERYRAAIAANDLFLLLVSFRRGPVLASAPGGDGYDAVLAFELALAQEHKIDVLAFLANERSWPVELSDDGEALQWVRRFRSGLNLPAVSFDSESEPGVPRFRDKLRNALITHKQKILARRAPAHAVNSVDDYARARDVLLRGECLLFLGSGIHGDGPLSDSALARELGEGGSADALATVAEFCERSRGSRENFLKRLREVITTQTADSKRSRIYEVAARAAARATAVAETRPFLVVSTGWDMLLEDCLAEFSPVIVSHVLHSENGRFDGQLLVLQPGAEPRFCRADELTIQRDACVIYKVMGSPLINARLNPDLGIDTVVATEADYATLLGRLPIQSSGIPNAINRYLKRRPLLFLGYTLELWHYRLVTHVFRTVRRGAESYVASVRRPRDQMEELAWQQLHASLVQMEIEPFADRILCDFPTDSAAL